MSELVSREKAIACFDSNVNRLRQWLADYVFSITTIPFPEGERQLFLALNGVESGFNLPGKTVGETTGEAKAWKEGAFAKADRVDALTFALADQVIRQMKDDFRRCLKPLPQDGPRRRCTHYELPSR